MARKIAIGACLLLLVLGAAGFFWARSVFANDIMRDALAAQISAAIGQPVAIRGISAGLYPRVTVDLDGVAIGQPPRIQARTLRLGTNFRALLSRRIVNGTVRLDGARVELPLLPLGSSKAAGASGGSSTWPVELVSIDEVVLSDVEVVSGARTLRGNINAVPHGNGLTLRTVSLTADDTNLSATGELTDLSGPVGHIDIAAGTLNFTRLLAFLSEFSSSSGMIGQAGSQPASPPAVAANDPNVTLSLKADRATLGTLALERLTSKARVTRNSVVLDPVAFGVFGGQYEGSVNVSIAGVPTFRWRATLSNVDVAAALAYAGNPGTMTGRLSGRMDLAGGGGDASNAIGDARGSVRVDIKDGIVKNLGLVRTVVVATSMRSDAKADVPASSDERFASLGATLAIANGAARTSDLEFESPDISLHAAGSVRLDGTAIDLKGNIQLSEALSQQAGRDLVRYTQEQGRVTLPATVTGTAQSPVARIDAGALAGRALKNKLNEEVSKTLNKALRGLFK